MIMILPVGLGRVGFDASLGSLFRRLVSRSVSVASSAIRTHSLAGGIAGGNAAGRDSRGLEVLSLLQFWAPGRRNAHGDSPCIDGTVTNFPV